MTWRTLRGAAGDPVAQLEHVRHELPVRYPAETENNSFLEIAVI